MLNIFVLQRFLSFFLPSYLPSIPPSSVDILRKKEEADVITYNFQHLTYTLMS